MEQINKSRIKSKSIDNIIYQGEVLFENIKNDVDLMAAANKAGYTQEKIEIGKTLLNELKEKIQLRDEKASEKLDTTKNVNKNMKTAHIAYMKNVNYAKEAFKDNTEFSDLLELNENRKTTFAKQIIEMEKFYNNIQKEEILTILAEFGRTIETINSDKALFDVVVSLDKLQESLKGEVKKLNKQKDDKLEEYTNWLNPFIKFLKMNLKGNSEILDKILIKN